MCIYTHTHTDIYIYIYIYREREGHIIFLTPTEKKFSAEFDCFQNCLTEIDMCDWKWRKKVKCAQQINSFIDPRHTQQFTLKRKTLN